MSREFLSGNWKYWSNLRALTAVSLYILSVCVCVRARACVCVCVSFSCVVVPRDMNSYCRSSSNEKRLRNTAIDAIHESLSGYQTCFIAGRLRFTVWPKDRLYWMSLMWFFPFPQGRCRDYKLIWATIAAFHMYNSLFSNYPLIRIHTVSWSELMSSPLMKPQTNTPVLPPVCEVLQFFWWPTSLATFFSSPYCKTDARTFSSLHNGRTYRKISFSHYRHNILLGTNTSLDLMFMENVPCRNSWWWH